jgi:CBS domain-containing protein
MPDGRSLISLFWIFQESIFIAGISDGHSQARPAALPDLKTKAKEITVISQQNTIESQPPRRIGFVTAGQLLRNKRGPANLVSVRPEQRVIEAVILMDGLELSELPVLEDGQLVGNISDVALARERHYRVTLGDKIVRDIMGPALMQVDVATDIHEVYRLLRQGQPALIVTREDLPVGFLNRLDLLDHWRRQPVRAWSEI